VKGPFTIGTDLSGFNPVQNKRTVDSPYA